MIFFPYYAAFHSFLSRSIRDWTQVALDRLLWTEALLYVMHYERLVQEPVKELTALLAFLGYCHSQRLHIVPISCHLYSSHSLNQLFLLTHLSVYLFMVI